MRLACIPFFFFVAAACGSASDDALFGGESGLAPMAGPDAGGNSVPNNATNTGTPADASVAAGGSANSDAGGGNANSGGLGGSEGDSGAGGTRPEAGSAGGASGSGAMRADAGLAPPPPPGAGLVRCAETPCQIGEGQACCLAAATVLTPNPTFECSTNPAECARLSFQCDADNDCAAGQVCCYERRTEIIGPTQSTVLETTCRESCDGVAPMQCAQPSDCPEGRTCCGDFEGTLSLTGGRYNSFTCATECPEGDRILCTTTDDCVRQGRTCNPSGVLPPGFSICEP